MEKADMQRRTERVVVLMTGAEVHAIDTWRRDQADLPNRSEALRRLLAGALKGAGYAWPDGADYGA